MRWGAILFWSAFIAAAAFRVYQSTLEKPPDIGACLGQKVQGTGSVADEPERKPTGQIFFISVDALSPGALSSAPSGSSGAPCPSGFLIRVKTKLYPRFGYGDELAFSGKLLIPQDFSGDDGRTFDYVGYLAKDDVFYEIRSAQASAISVSAPPNRGIIAGISSNIHGWLFFLRRRFVANLERSLGDPDAALAAGLAVGEKTSLGPDLLADFRTVGLIHIVILSGYSVGIIVIAIRRMLSYFLPRVWSIGIAAAALVSFCLMVGAGATVVRACSMALVVLAADLLRRDYSIWRALLLVVLIMIIINPAILLHDSSFQISVLATAGLILLAKPIESRLRFIPKRTGLRHIIASTAATQIFVSPYILYMMGQLSLVGIVVNILALPLIPVTMLAVYLTGGSGFISAPVSQAIGWVAHLLLGYDIALVEWFAKVPYASVQFPPFSGWWVVGAYGMFFAGYALLKRRRKPKRI